MLARARAAGVAGDPDDRHAARQRSSAVLAIAEADPGVYCSVGVHPHQAAKEPLEDAAPLLARIGHPKVIGIGESGLDYYYEHSPQDVQAQVFRAHIEAARPERAAADRRIPATPTATRSRSSSEAMAAGRFAGVIHCYSSSPELACARDRARLLPRHRRHPHLQALGRAARDRARAAARPPAARDRRALSRARAVSRPAQRAGLCRLGRRPSWPRSKAMPVAEVERATTENFFRLFAKARPPAGAACG